MIHFPGENLVLCNIPPIQSTLMTDSFTNVHANCSKVGCICFSGSLFWQHSLSEASTRPNVPSTSQAHHYWVPSMMDPMKSSIGCAQSVIPVLQWFDIHLFRLSGMLAPCVANALGVVRATEHCSAEKQADLALFVETINDQWVSRGKINAFWQILFVQWLFWWARRKNEFLKWWCNWQLGKATQKDHTLENGTMQELERDPGWVHQEQQANINSFFKWTCVKITNNGWELSLSTAEFAQMQTFPSLTWWDLELHGNAVVHTPEMELETVMIFVVVCMPPCIVNANIEKSSKSIWKLHNHQQQVTVAPSLVK